MKLILNSRGLNTITGAEQIHTKLKNVANKKILIVSLPGYELDEYIKENCIKILGFLPENIFFSEENHKDLTSDYVYLTEGNTYEVLDYLVRKNLMDYIKRVCNEEATYIGSSAGAMIAGKDINAAKDMGDEKKYFGSYEGLNFFDGLILPHYTPKQAKMFVKNCELEGRYRQIISVDNDHVIEIEV